MKRKLLICCLLILSSFTYSQIDTERCISGSTTIYLGQTVTFSSNYDSECLNCYDWDINDESGSSDNDIVGNLQIVGSDNLHNVSINAISLGDFTISLTFFTEKEGCINCTIRGTVISPPCWKDISVGGMHSLGLKSDGTLWSWGFNNSGQLGLGDISIEDVNIPTLINSDTNWSKVSAGNHSLAIKTNGTLWAWGRNFHGQLGDGTNSFKISPIQIGNGTNWKEVSAGMEHTLAIKTDGSLWAWGLNSSGQLGDGTNVSKNLPVRIGLDSNWLKIAAFHGHSVAIKTDGTLWTWGYNGNGQLGDGTTINKLAPQQIGVDLWKEIGGSWQNTTAIKTNGTLWSCGGNSYGQLGDGTLISKLSLVQIGTNQNWSKVSRIGDYHNLATRSNGTLWAWGLNKDWWGYNINIGQLGDGTYVDKSSPVQIGNQLDWKIISAGGTNSAGIKLDGTLFTWGYGEYGGLGNGTYATSVNTPNAINCPNLNVPKSLTNNGVYINDKKIYNINIYPNPTSGNLKISIKNEIISKINLFNFQGKLLEIKDVNNFSGSLDLTPYKKGTYIIEVVTKSGSQKEKIIKD